MADSILITCDNIKFTSPYRHVRDEWMRYLINEKKKKKTDYYSGYQIDMVCIERSVITLTSKIISLFLLFIGNKRIGASKKKIYKKITKNESEDIKKYNETKKNCHKQTKENLRRGDTLSQFFFFSFLDIITSIGNKPMKSFNSSL